ncbi:MAG TPA: carboxypeptidase regulatory-like domain-containing protein [Terracidiphilus sp.]|nr:carboxypeptidase regulatory-like domain-containing protein [Terracidiphilus sp.]
MRIFHMDGKEGRMFRCSTMLLVLGLILGLGMSTERAFADNVYASIRGTVTDATGAVIAGATVKAVNADTGVATVVTTSDRGDFVFPQLQIGHYDVELNKDGFKSFKATGILLVVNQVYSLGVKLQVGAAAQTVEVAADAIQVETSDTQLKTLVDAAQIVDLPLNGRNWTSLELAAPGVQAADTRFGSNYSVNGSQAQQSSYLINGQDSNDIVLNSPLIIPSPDAIAQFNLIGSTINAEYGRNSGGIVNAILKSGTNSFHGDVFEFYRDSFLNDRNWFQKVAPQYHQNQFGATFGGPFLIPHLYNGRDKSFFFFSYQGERARQPGTLENQRVLSPAQLGGDWSMAENAPFTLSDNPIPFAVQGPNGACGPNTSNTTWTSCFPTNQIPTSNFNPIATSLAAQYNPTPNTTSPAGDPNYYTWTSANTVLDDQYIGRIDQNFNANNRFWGTVFEEHNNRLTPIPFTGSTLPGFPSNNDLQYRQYIGSYTRVFSPTMLNELRGGYTRMNFKSGNPVTVTDPSTYGFQNIVPQDASAAGLPTIAISKYFTLGTSTNGPQPRIDQTMQADDNFSWVVGRHTLKFGFSGRRFQVYNNFDARNSGSFSFTSGGSKYSTGDPGLDFLMGIPTTYLQNSASLINVRAYEDYFYGQDSFQATSSLTINYGLGYQIDTPLNNFQQGKIGVICFQPNVQSSVFPTAPAGMTYPGDKGCTMSGYSTNYSHFGPRIGFAFAPMLGRLTGGADRKLSIRGGWGMYYNRTEEEGNLQNLGIPPFGLNSNGIDSYVTGSVPSFTDPYSDVAGNGAVSTPFPYQAPAAGETNIDFTQFYPMSLNTFSNHYQMPAAENFQLTIERELPGSQILSVGYVGSVGRHLERNYEQNLITAQGQQACLNDYDCVHLDSTGNYVGGFTFQHYFYPDHSLYPGDVFASVGTEYTDGSSNYSSLQVKLVKKLTHGLFYQVAYTYSHALDNGSSLENTGYQDRGTNPYPQFAHLNYGSSTFDARNRFVVNYSYEVPIPASWRSNAFARLALGGWKGVGLTTLADGHPVTLSDYELLSLTCDGLSYYACADVPQQLKPAKYTDPRHGAQPGLLNTAFDTTAFAQEPVGTFGNAGRNFFRGPGINNTDLSVLKDLRFTESSYLELRIEGFNLFNHTQFDGPDGEFADGPGSFGVITTAASGRVVQLGTKLYF